MCVVSKQSVTRFDGRREAHDRNFHYFCLYFVEGPFFGLASVSIGPLRLRPMCEGPNFAVVFV